MVKTLSETLPVASSSQSEEIEEELDQEKTQDSKLRPTRPPRTIWHTVTVHGYTFLHQTMTATLMKRDYS